MASGTSGKRRTTTRKKTTASRKTTAKRKEENAFIRDEVTVLILFAVSILLLISNFGVGGAAGSFVSGIMFGLFGIFAYILPVVLFLVTAFSISNRDNTIAAVKVGAMVIAGVLLCAAFQLLFGEKDGVGTITAFYTYASEHKTGGGALGGLICKALTGAFGLVGAWIILLVLFIICAVVITERSFIGGVKTGSKRVYDTAREDARRYRIQAEERREARQKALEEQALEQEEEPNPKPVSAEPRRPRREHRVSGIALEETVIKGPTEKENFIKNNVEPEDTAERQESYTDEMREITLPDLKDLDDMFRIPIHRERPEKAEEEEEPAEAPVDTHPETFAAEITKDPEPVKEAPKQQAAPIPAPPVSAEKQDPVRTQPASTPIQVEAEYLYPPLRLLKQVRHTENRDADRILHDTALHLQQILRDFGVGVTVTDVSQGPAVTRYELQPDQGVKVNKIVSLADDIKLNLAVTDVRIEAPIPGKAAVGIEVPNAENSIVSFRELVSSQEFKAHKSRLAFAVGKDIAGKIMVTDIAKMPHLLIAGATGSGKSVCINTLIMSLLYKATPDEVKLIMIDPKVVELSTYNGIPHLLIPVVTDPKKAAGALNWAVAEMTHRYKLFADYNVRNLEGYNEKIKNIEHIEDDTKPRKLPQIVIVVDELADLMMVAPGEVEDAICRLAQLARAAGIHLIIATQRPSVNVITGLIKANMPSRIAFAVSSGVDSRTILDMNGAEKLLGKGDMLFYPYGYPKPVRVQGAFVSDEEVSAVVEFLKENNSGNGYSTAVEEHINTVQTSEPEAAPGGSGDGPERDPLFAEAGRFIIEKDKASIGMLQRWFKVGFNRAARIMDQLAEAGVVGEEAGTKPREIRMSMEEFERYLEEYV
ncbi:DNA translocase FtsK 4TM domain-containing protein [Candidatus Merdisoma sp. HCP28S3_D10]|uniref:FtsK/SpoIIIE family DNA translocase n=1 Tax=unclassified Candidatus Merdisoma TaxID=3099611 RepID=UPI003F8C3F0D